jgi:hypothetical protein
MTGVFENAKALPAPAQAQIVGVNSLYHRKPEVANISDFVFPAKTGLFSGS